MGAPIPSPQPAKAQIAFKRPTAAASASSCAPGVSSISAANGGNGAYAGHRNTAMIQRKTARFYKRIAVIKLLIHIDDTVFQTQGIIERAAIFKPIADGLRIIISFCVIRNGR